MSYLHVLLSFMMSCLVFSNAYAKGAQPPVAPSRFAEESWEEALERILPGVAPRGSALDSARLYRPDLDPSHLPEWTGSLEDLASGFVEARDERVYEHPRDFPRRSSWLYPNDGCYARAAHVARSFESHSRLRPGKVFAFANLRLKTPYSSRGTVYWWYHVAPAFRLGNDVVVLDPSVEALRPIPLEEWLKRISRNIESVKVALCDTYAYTPSSRCTGASSRSEGNSVSHQKRFLPLEWNRLLQLRMNPRELLGDSPPWKSDVSEEPAESLPREPDTHHSNVLQMSVP